MSKGNKKLNRLESRVRNYKNSDCKMKFKR